MQLYHEEKADTSVAHFKSEEHQLEDDLQLLLDCKRHLDIYRSHLARHKTEGEYDSREVAELQDHVAIIICDLLFVISR
jgi:hypothetical protein